MREYKGDMEFYQKQLADKGITKEQLDMNKFIGLSESDLQYVVDNADSFIDKNEFFIEQQEARELCQEIKESGIPLKSQKTLISLVKLHGLGGSTWQD